MRLAAKARARVPQPRETAIQAAILRALAYRRADAFLWRNNTGAFQKPNGRPVFFGKTGSADILGVVAGGRFFALEVKRPGREPSDAQLDFAARVEAHGGFYAVVTSVQEALAALDQAIASSKTGRVA